jgi:hypothetical protein
MHGPCTADHQPLHRRFARSAAKAFGPSTAYDAGTVATITITIETDRRPHPAGVQQLEAMWPEPSAPTEPRLAAETAPRLPIRSRTAISTRQPTTRRPRPMPRQVLHHLAEPDRPSRCRLGAARRRPSERA